MLRKVTVEAAFYTVNSGIVGLSGAQAKVRLHNLKALQVDKKTGGGEFEVVNPIMFKHGEEFGYSGTINRAGVLTDPEVERQAKAARADSLEAAHKAGEDAGRAAALALHAKRMRELGGAVALAQAEAKAEFLGALLAKLPPEVAAVVGPFGDELLGKKQ